MTESVPGSRHYIRWSWLLVVALVCSSLALAVDIPEEDAAAAVFRQYCAAANIIVHPDLRLGVQTSRGTRGVVAAKALTSGATLAAVPLGSMLTVEHAVTDTRFGALWDAIPDLTDMDILAAYLASPTVQHNSSHSGYIRYLPRDNRDALHLGPDALQLLSPSPVAARLSRRLKDLEESLEVIVGTARSGQNVDPAIEELGDKLNMSEFRWAHAMLRSRSHKVAVKDSTGQWQDAMAMVPVADLFNTDLRENEEVNVKCFTGDEGWGPQSIFYCKTTRKVAKGEELLVTYLQHPSRRTSGNILLEYGFVPQDNPFDALPITLPDAPEKADGLLRALKIDSRVAVLPLLKDTAQLDELRVTLYFSVCQLITLHPGAWRWSPTQIQVHVEAPEVRRATYTAMIEHLERLLDTYPADLQQATLAWDVDLVQQLLRSETRIITIAVKALAFALKTLDMPMGRTSGQ